MLKNQKLKIDFNKFYLDNLSMETEIWKPVPPILIGDTVSSYEVSNFGKIRDRVTLIPIKTASNLSENQYGKYQHIMHNNKTFYLHRLIYGAFNPKIADQVSIGTIMFKNFDPVMVDANKVYRVYLEDLLFKPSIYKNKSKMLDINLPPEKAIHPIYGEFFYYKPMPVIAHRTDKKTKVSTPETYSNYTLILIKNNEFPCKILGSKELSINISADGHDPFVNFSKDKKSIKYLLTHVLLATVFPNIPPLFTVDHIDDNPKNHDVINLQWMSRSKNARKGQIKSCLTPRIGKTVYMICPNTDECLKKFISISEAGKYIKETYGKKAENENENENENEYENEDEYEEKIKKQQYEGSAETMSNKISHSIKSNRRIKAYKFYWDTEIDIPIECEIWKQLPEEYAKLTYEISNKGRIKKTYGIITLGCPLRGRKYRFTDIIADIDESGENIFKKYYIHQLVWLTFNGPLPSNDSGLEILHDDNAPLDKDNYYRNWLVDLRLGTRSENNKERYAALKTKIV